MIRNCFKGFWEPIRRKHVGPLEVQILDYCCSLVDHTGRTLHSTMREKIVEPAIRRAIDLADAMQTVVVIDVDRGSVIVSPGDSFADVLEVYFEVRK
jgi:hypothetical protein